MPNRPDLRQISGNIREALADCDRETLVDMLTFVFKAYVVEGPPPMLVNQTERISDLEGLSLAQLIRTLQTRLDLPELSLFQVDGEQVSVRVHGTMTPLETTQTGWARGGAMAAPAATAPAPRPEDRGPGVRVVETRFERRAPAQTATRGTSQGATASPGPMEPPAPPAAGQGSAQPPRRGLSVRGASVGGSREASAQPAPGVAPASGSAPGSAASPSPAGPAAGPSGQPAGRPAGREEPAAKSPRAGEEDLASTRFSLLELD